MSERRYTIEKPHQEGPCGGCGYPLYVGDSAWENREEGVYGACTRACLREAVHMFNGGPQNLEP